MGAMCENVSAVIQRIIGYELTMEDGHVRVKLSPLPIGEIG